MKLFLGLLLFLFISCESNPVDKVKKLKIISRKKGLKTNWIGLNSAHWIKVLFMK